MMDEIVHSTELSRVPPRGADLAEACVAGGSRYDHLRTVVDATEACLGVMERGDPYSPRERPSVDELLEAHAAHLRSKCAGSRPRACAPKSGLG